MIEVEAKEKRQNHRQPCWEKQKERRGCISREEEEEEEKEKGSSTVDTTEREDK